MEHFEPLAARLAEAVMNLELPNPQTRALFAPRVAYRDIGPSPNLASAEGPAPTEPASWPPSADATAVVAELSLWRPLFEEVLYFTSASFEIEPGVADALGDELETPLHFRALAWSVSGRALSIEGRQRLVWMKRMAGAEGDWRIAQWITEDFEVAPLRALPPAAATGGPLRVFPLHQRAGRRQPRLAIYTTMATWCTTCLGELPHWGRLGQIFSSEELEIRAVPVDNADTPEKLERYVARHAPAYTLLSRVTAADVASVNHVVVRELGKDGLPASFLTDELGQILASSWGPPSVSQIRQLLANDARSGEAH